jgi:hypothetical protein
MTSEGATVDLTRAIKSVHARRTYEARHRVPVNTDRRAWVGLLLLLAAGVFGTGITLHLVGWW